MKKPNEHGVYSMEDAEKYSFKSKDISVDVFILKVKNVFINAESINTFNWGYGSPLTLDNSFNTRNDAFNDSIKTLNNYNVGKKVIFFLQKIYKRDQIQLDFFET